jgi:hypothetical protein
MKLTQKQIDFLDIVCSNHGWTVDSNGEVSSMGVWMSNMKMTEIPVKFSDISGTVFIRGNNLTEYFQNIKEEDFPFPVGRLDYNEVLDEYPFLINIIKKHTDGRKHLNHLINTYPLTKLYLKD